jgi:malate synthase
MTKIVLPTGVELKAPAAAGQETVLTPEALAFIVGLERKFGAERHRLLAKRDEVQAWLDAGNKPVFPPETQEIRDSEWTVAPLPADILDRRVEITGPVDRKMIINALNSGAHVFMADFEDSSTPTWANLIEGQINLRDAIAGTITYTDPTSGKGYKLAEKTAVLFVRPRGWHLPEAHLIVDGQPMSGALFDFGLYFFHNAKALLAKGSGPYFYLPKMESRFEARLWNEVFLHAQAALGVPAGSIKATVLIETILASFEMDEILWELKQHSAGLNCGRWDYIFSFIKKFAADPASVLPDRGQVTMTTHFLRSYSQRVIQVCHRRNVHAMGGMAAQIPIKNDPDANDAAMAKVKADKEREAGDGHDGTWVAHPADLVVIPEGTKTEAGLRQNIAVGIGYIEAWLRGIGCVPLFNLMEDAATAEISRAQVWQWRRHGASLEDGRKVDAALIRSVLDDELRKIDKALSPEAVAEHRYAEAAALFLELVETDRFETFLTLPAYKMVASAH